MSDSPPARWTWPQRVLAAVTSGTLLAVLALTFTDSIRLAAWLPLPQAVLVLAVLFTARRQQGNWRWLFAAGPTPPSPAAEPPHFQRMRDPAATARTLRTLMILVGLVAAAAAVCGLVGVVAESQNWMIAAGVIAAVAGMIAFTVFIAVPARIGMWGWASFPRTAQRVFAATAGVVWVTAVGFSVVGLVRANASPPPAVDETLPFTEPRPADDEPSHVIRRIGSSDGRVGRHAAGVAFSPDGRFVLAGGTDGVTAFDASTLRAGRVLPPPEFPPPGEDEWQFGRPGVTSLGFPDGGRTLLVGGGSTDVNPDHAKNGWYQLWAWGETPKPTAAGPTGSWALGQVIGHPHSAERLVGRGEVATRYFTRPPTRSVRWFGKAGSQPCELPGEFEDQVRRLVWSPDGRRVFAAAERGARSRPNDSWWRGSTGRKRRTNVDGGSL